ncbi:hypothetical protein Q765_04800 [Flavobacterium rivuli WB 3.3-2 = DSM 21788]|uniref:HTTM-like domain-containing protein n=1 Tax=Flavobacterium rivuli WB 3.3-2 = DSM 21788 TaxID=1121895 RepID=A0A0A2M586_9FLAO|nr:hypothetical protein [Flavobacterium rivuli]KGO87812.1 hypothetical protein Q765_04800 [Flavobacterium rivuli WB 3.3-2 = DSM 21788]
MPTVIKNINNFLSGIEKLIIDYTIPDKNILLFRQCVYILLLAKILFIWPELNMLYRHGIDIGLASPMPHKFMYLPLLHNFYNIYWLVASVIVAIAIFSKRSRFLNIVVAVISINYLEVITGTSDGGDKLHNFVIFMLIFIRDGALKNSLQQMINNAAVFIIQMHFCFLYFLNAYGKVIHKFWRDGSFFNDVWHLSYFANPNFVPYYFFNSTVQIITAWSVILFEFLFPTLIWFKPFKKPLIFIGIFFHFGISIFLSIPDFGAIMIIVYILFYDFKKVENLKYFKFKSYRFRY